MHKKHLLVAAGILTVSAPAFSAGFEKSSFWSGKYSGIAGAAASSAEGAEALYWNPAGMSDGHEGFEVSGNISPTFAKFSAPIVVPNQTIDGKTLWIPPFGAFVSYGVNKDWTVGFGIYTGAGTRSEYDNVDFTSVAPTYTYQPTLKSTLTVIEYSLGTSYQVMPGLKIGAAWRIVHASADLASAKFDSSNNLVATDLEGLGQTRYNGFRVGAQYESESKNWGVGATWRTSMNFSATGNATVTTQGPSTGNAIVSGTGTGTASLNFPSQISLGGHYDLIPQTLRGFAQYTWTQFHNDQAIPASGLLTAGTLAGTPFSGSTALDWNNENTLRFGLECSAVQDWKFRVGYSWGNQVQPTDQAKPTLVAPGHGQTFALGAGTSILAHTLDLDGSIQYDVATGNVPTGTSTATPGDYNSHDWTLNLGATYRF